MNLKVLVFFALIGLLAAVDRSTNSTDPGQCFHADKMVYGRTPPVVDAIIEITTIPCQEVDDSLAKPYLLAILDDLKKIVSDPCSQSKVPIGPYTPVCEARKSRFEAIRWDLYTIKDGAFVQCEENCPGDDNIQKNLLEEVDQAILAVSVWI